MPHYYNHCSNPATKCLYIIAALIPLAPIESPGMALGIDKETRFDKLIQDGIVTLQSKIDSVTFFTDGVNETQNNNEDEFGMERLKQSIETMKKMTPKQGHAQFLSNIIKEIKHIKRFYRTQ
ncbi:MAG: SpoIIE family protein phosphatase [Verrucomicrobiia bacterium]